MKNLNSKAVCDRIKSCLAVGKYAGNIFKITRYIALKEANYRSLDCGINEESKKIVTASKAKLKFKL